MAKPAIVFVCADCGAETLKWQGQCPQCSQWNTLEQRSVVRRPAAPAVAVSPPAELSGLSDGELPRLQTGMSELDRVLGGGLIPGSVTLLGGEPGIGKSTLLLQLANHAARVTPTLYLSAEESAAQIGVRARRLGVSGSHLRVVADTDLEAMMARARDEAVKLLIVDSIQTVQLSSVGTAAGAITQLKECTAQLVRFAKSTGVSVIIVGHVTKDGAIAGPQRARAPGRHGAVLRERCIQPFPQRARHQEPLRFGRANWRSSTWASPGCAKCATHRQFSWRVLARRRRAAS